MIIALQYCIGFCCSVQFSHSVAQSCLFATPWTAVHQGSLFIANSWSLLKLMSVESLMPSNHLILCCPLLLPPSAFPCIRVFSNESALHIRWPEYWSASASSEYSGLISFRMDRLDLLAVQGTLKSLLQLCNSMNQLYMCPHPHEAPSQHPLPPLQVSESTRLGSLCYAAASH